MFGALLAMRQLENSLCQPSSKWVLFFRIKEGKSLFPFKRGLKFGVFGSKKKINTETAGCVRLGFAATTLGYKDFNRHQTVLNSFMTYAYANYCLTD